MKQILINLQEIFIKSKPCERIRFLRKQKNLTIKQVSEKCITTEKAWSDWERGKSIPRDINQKRIAMVLGVNKDDIFGNPKGYINL